MARPLVKKDDDRDDEAPLSKGVIEGFLDKYPMVKILQRYGLTESMSVGASTDLLEKSCKYGTVGLLSPSMEAKIVDSKSGGALPVNRTGELWLRGPTIMKVSSMATLLRSLYMRSSKLAFSSSGTSVLPGFTNSSSAFVAKPCVTFVVPNRSPPGYTYVVMLQNVLASSSQEDLKNLMKDAQVGKLKLPSSQLFEICCKLYDKSYTSPQEKLYRFIVFEDNLKRVIFLNKMQNDWFNDGTLRLCFNFRHHFERTKAEIRRAHGCGLVLEKWMGNVVLCVKDIESLLDQLLRRRCQYYCERGTSSQNLSKIEVEILCLLLEVLEGVIKYRWNALPVEQRDGMKNYISDVIVQLSSNEASFWVERLYVNKLNIILVQILKHDWPARWQGFIPDLVSAAKTSSFIPDLVSAAKTSETICENCMAILKELLKALIGFIDVAGLYFALTQLTHRNISQNHKFQAVGLGWAFTDSVLHRLAPLWVGARGLKFTWDYILQGLESNANLFVIFGVLSLSIDTCKLTMSLLQDTS
ncbi:hypothetical protein FNV43_RR00685 [Rhamnella rubrinervis]|uniref:BOS complex subunit TMEM147 n=1 Tax=Rhamnella rubrinervis TaxID=2594499 RepID=A0A8K0HNH1_9ROSA|nr:hypothetical protein FNV43_RR00685 [Rhamnella rubrinervis]